MEILLVRHGLAGKADPERWPDDEDRPVTPKGRRVFAEAAEGLVRIVPEPAAILTSPAVRALMTARLLADAFGHPRRRIVLVPALRPHATARSALAALRRLAPEGPVAVVGHEPGLGRLASLLVSGGARAALPLGKGGACLITTGAAEGPEAFAPGAGGLDWLLPAHHLRKLARR